MSNRYRCIETFYLPMLDDNENEIENEEVRVEEGTVWERQKMSYLSDVRLQIENDTDWIEIANDTLARYFKELEGAGRMKVITVTNIKLRIPEDKTIILERDNPYLHVRSQVKNEIENFIKDHLEYDYTVEELEE